MYPVYNFAEANLATNIFDEPEEVLLSTTLPDKNTLASVDFQLQAEDESNTGNSDGSSRHGRPTLTAREVATVLSLEALQSCHGIISHLQRLSIAIRRASASEYNVEIARERDKKNGYEEGSDDERCMKELVEHRFPTALKLQERQGKRLAEGESSTNKVGPKAEVEVEPTLEEGPDDERCPKELDEHRFPIAENAKLEVEPTVDDVELKKLREYIITAMSFRVRRFRHRKRLHIKNVEIQRRKAAVRETVPLEDTNAAPSQIERILSEESKQGSGGSTQQNGASNRGSERPSYDSALYVPPAPSTVSSTFSTGSTRSAIGKIAFYWPSRPHPSEPDAEGKVVYKCPYCFDHLEVEEAQDKKKWR